MKCSISKYQGQNLGLYWDLYPCLQLIEITAHWQPQRAESKEQAEEVLHFTLAVNQKSSGGDLTFDFLGSCGCN